MDGVWLHSNRQPKAAALATGYQKVSDLSVDGAMRTAAPLANPVDASSTGQDSDM